MSTHTSTPEQQENITPADLMAFTEVLLEKYPLQTVEPIINYTDRLATINSQSEKGSREYLETNYLLAWITLRTVRKSLGNEDMDSIIKLRSVITESFQGLLDMS